MVALDDVCFEASFRFSRSSMRRFAEAKKARVVVAEEDGELAGGVFGVGNGGVEGLVEQTAVGEAGELIVEGEPLGAGDLVFEQFTQRRGSGTTTVRRGFMGIADVRQVEDLIHGTLLAGRTRGV